MAVGMTKTADTVQVIVECFNGTPSYMSFRLALLHETLSHIQRYMGCNDGYSARQLTIIDKTRAAHRRSSWNLNFSKALLL